MKCLRERPCLEAFVNEWTIAQLAWVERLSDTMPSQSLREAVKHMVLEAVNAYDGPGQTRFVDYKLLALSQDAQDPNTPQTPGSLFLAGFGERLARIPARSFLAPRKTLTPSEQVEIMQAVNQGYWVDGFSLSSTLEAFRERATAEIISVS